MKGIRVWRLAAMALPSGWRRSTSPSTFYQRTIRIIWTNPGNKLWIIKKQSRQLTVEDEPHCWPQKERLHDTTTQLLMFQLPIFFSFFKFNLCCGSGSKLPKLDMVPVHVLQFFLWIRIHTIKNWGKKLEWKTKNLMRESFFVLFLKENLKKGLFTFFQNW